MDNTPAPTPVVLQPAAIPEPQYPENFVQPGYTVTNNTTISFSNYTFMPNAYNFVGQILSPDINNSFGLSDRDRPNAIVRHDSLFLTAAGLKKLVSTNYLDLAMLINNNSNNSKY